MEPQQRLRVRRRRRLVHEVHVDLPPRRRVEPLRPPLQVVVRVRFEPQPHVAPGRRLHERRRRVVLALGQAQRRAGFPERRVDVVGKPGVAAKLERRAVVGGKDAEKGSEARQVLLEIRRQLEQDRTALGAERREVAIEIAERFGGRLRLDPGDVRDPARRLDREAKVRGRRGLPALQHLRPGHPVERVVDLDGRQAFRVVGEHFLGLDLLGIEGSLPLLERIAARSRQKPRRRHFPILVTLLAACIARIPAWQRAA